MSSAAAPQTNGVSASASQTPQNSQAAPAPSQATQNTTATAATAATTTTPTAAGNSQSQSQSQQQANPPPSPFTSAPRPRDARMLELLMTSQGVTSYEARVPLLLMDFAYRHTSAVLNDALHLTVDPHTSHAGARAASTAGATATLIGADATVSANAVRLAIASRQGYQFRGGNNSGGLSKEWLQELAKERNKVALPRVAPNEWAVRLPSERFVLSGLSWGLKDVWADENSSGDEDEEMEDALGGNTGPGAMDGIEAPDLDDVEAEGGTMEDVFGDEMDEDQATA